MDAEMAVTLYDASLDGFRPVRWNFNIIPPMDCSPPGTSEKGLIVNGHFPLTISGIQMLPVKQYPTFNWFGYRFNGYFRSVLDEEPVPTPWDAPAFVGHSEKIVKGALLAGRGIGYGGGLGKKEMETSFQFLKKIRQTPNKTFPPLPPALTLMKPRFFIRA